VIVISRPSGILATISPILNPILKTTPYPYMNPKQKKIIPQLTAIVAIK
jgi:hypothetical protein